MNPRLKQIIKNKLSEDLSSASIIDYSGSIWFIDAKSKYWYLELYKKTKTLWWRLDFFEDFFTLFGMEQNEFVPIITEWVEEVLNTKVGSIPRCGAASKRRVEEVLDGEIVSTGSQLGSGWGLVEEVLNSEVVSTQGTPGSFRLEVEEVLNSEIVSTNQSDFPFDRHVEDAVGMILKGEAVSTRRQKLRQETQVGKILNTEAASTDQMFIQEVLVQELLKNS